jgi:catechol 2,3-dioxygenase-like lactoylglutathione lyase family enzyme
MITGIGQIHITVTDLDASVAFYRDVLGLTLLFVVPGQQMAFLDAGGVRLYLGHAESDQYRSRPLIYFRVDDLAATHAVVTARGASSLSEPHRVHRDERHELWMAAVSDPDGIPVVFMQEVPPHEGPGPQDVAG